MALLFFAFATKSMRFSFVSNLWPGTCNYTGIVRLHVKPGDCATPLVRTLVNRRPSSTQQRSGLFSK